MSAEDLDSFLTTLESKLRGPFSSMELSKAISSTSTSGGEEKSALHYLESVSEVLPRAEKVTQLRILTGLLGLDPSFETNDVILKILKSAQEAPLYDEWVRVVAGMVQSIIFGDSDVQNNNSDQMENGKDNGEEAKKIMEKTCKDIISKVRTVERQTAVIDEETEYRLGHADVDPTFAPFRYALLRPSLLGKAIPETTYHDHLQVDESAKILHEDEEYELERANEEEEHKLSGTNAKTGSAVPTAQTKQSDAPNFPGFGKAKAKTAATKTRAPFLMPSKRPGIAGPGALRGRTPGMRPTGGIKPVQKTVLHKRKAGAAQALLGKNRSVAMSSTSQTAAPNAARTSAVNRMTNARSKMKMIDVAEVQGLESKKQDVDTAPPLKRGRKAQLLTGNKRNKPDTSTDQMPEKVSRQKTTDSAATTDDVSTTKEGTAAQSPEHPATAGALATAALSAYQKQMAAESSDNHHHGSPQHRQQDWRQLLKEKSNKISEEDRNRVQQFFVNHFNPTPEQTMYKMKLHEERTNDPKTGEPVKETYYLELDYSNFTSKQSKKIKRYK